MTAKRDPGIDTATGVCGGEPVIAGTRIPVWVLERARRLGSTEADLLRLYPGLHTDDLVAEVEVHLVEGDGGWAPYLSLDDAYKLDDVREALKSGDVDRTAALASRVYRLTPVA
jgi:uncharacterized protein (DUF433 family)